MARTVKNRIWNLCGIAVALIPWLTAMYLFYWLESSGTWTADTPHRGKVSVALLACGMGLSFLLHSLFRRRRKA